MTAQERRDMQKRKRILDKTGVKNYELRDRSGKVIYSKRTRTMDAAKKDLEARKTSGKTAAERADAAMALDLIAKVERAFFGGTQRTTREIS